MFKITEETKAEAVEAMRVVLGEGATDAQLNEAFEVAVAIVKKQFGM